MYISNVYNIQYIIELKFETAEIQYNIKEYQHSSY